MRDDLEAMERHQQAGTLKGWFDGTAAPTPNEEHLMPLDPSAARPSLNTFRFITQRGD